MIELRHLSKSFTSDSRRCDPQVKTTTSESDSTDEVAVLCDINLRIEAGDVFGIIGVSGAGKSTLARCVNLLEHPTSGQVIVDGRDVTHLTGRDLLDLRASIGFVFQDFNLFSQRTALENVTFPLEVRKDSKERRYARGQELLELVGLLDKATAYPAQLSGGQQQRVSIARALANHPRYLLWDEATSALDTLTTNSILGLLRDINRELTVTMLVITHEMSVVRKVCNKVAVLDKGRIVEQGSVQEVFTKPQQAVTKELLGEVILNV